MTRAASLAALLLLACGTNDPAGDTGDSTAAASGPSTGDPSSSGTTVAQECTPGDSKPTAGGGCFCECSDAGLWACERCAPTTSDATTSDATSDGTSTDATLTGSDTTDATSTGDATATGTTGADTTTGDAFLPACGELAPSDSYEILTATIVDDELLLVVSYSGGCETHEFVLCLDAIDPDTDAAVLAVDHDNNGDACKVLVMETQKLDLTPLQQSGPSPFEFTLAGYPDGSFSYEY